MKFTRAVFLALAVVVALIAAASARTPCRPVNCGDDAKCPKYLKSICGSYNGEFKIFAGDCYMKNYSCRTCTQYVTVPDVMCHRP